MKRSELFFAWVVHMRREQKNPGVQKLRELLPEELQTNTTFEKLVDDEIERVEKLYEERGLKKFWEK